MTWQIITKNGSTFMQNGTSTICIVYLEGMKTYELFHEGKQYHGFQSSRAAKDKYESLVK